MWLRKRTAPRSGGGRGGWIARLGRALVRWLRRRSGASGSSRSARRQTTAQSTDVADGDVPQPSPPAQAPPNQPQLADEAVASLRTDVPPPSVESPSRNPKRVPAVASEETSADLAAPATAETLDETGAAPRDPSPPNSTAREEEVPTGPSESIKPIPAPAPSDQARDNHQEASATVDGAAETSAPSSPHPVAPATAPVSGPAADPPPAPPSVTTGGPDLSSPATPSADGEGGQEGQQSPPWAEDASAPSDPAPLDRDRPSIGDATSDQSEGKPDRKASSSSGKVQRYRPRLRRPPAQAPSKAAGPSPEPSQPVAGTLEAGYLLTFLPGEWGLSMSVLMSRIEGMPEVLDVRAGGESYPLEAISDNQFAPIQPSSHDLISAGFVAETDGEPVRRWIRTARDIHAFSPRPGVSGFASVPRVLIGQENVVLCKAPLALTVQQCASAAGSDPLIEVEGPGIPEGWRCFRSYWPRHPADFGAVDDIFLALNPLPDASIQLSGGIESARGIWALGAPPIIRVLGAVPLPGELSIDGKAAAQSSDQEWTAPGWDSLGSHTIHFAGLSRTYEIAKIEEDWPSWTTAGDTAFSACGARVSAATGRQALAITGGPYWLLGAAAGDLALASRSSRAVSMAAPAFPPVWALPPIGPGRQSPAIALTHRAAPRPPSASRSRDEIVRWCQLIRRAGSPNGSSEVELWREYRKFARSLRRKWR